MGEALVLHPLVVVAFVVVLPVCYQLNDCVTPWARGRLNEDGDRYLEFWTATAVLHWTSTLAVLGVVVGSRSTLAAIGLGRPHHVGTALAGAMFVASVGLYYRDVIDRPEIATDRVRRAGDFWTPATDRERRLGVFVLGVTPGICEEVVYRGFVLTGLLSLGVPPWVALGGATVPFVLLHGRGATTSVQSFTRYALFGVLFGGLYLWYGTLWPGIALHAGYNLAQTARGSRRYFVPARR